VLSAARIFQAKILAQKNVPGKKKRHWKTPEEVAIQK
jgi:hypothetical protein